MNRIAAPLVSLLLLWWTFVGCSAVRAQTAFTTTDADAMSQAAATLADLHRRLAAADRDTRREHASEIAARVGSPEKDEFETTAQFERRMKKADAIGEELQAKYARLREERRGDVYKLISEITRQTFERPLTTRLGTYDADAQRFPLFVTVSTGAAEERSLPLIVGRTEARELKENFAEAAVTGATSLYVDFGGSVREHTAAVAVTFRGGTYRTSPPPMNVAHAMRALYPGYDAAQKRAPVEFTEEETEEAGFPADEPVYAAAFFSREYREGGADKFLVLTAAQPEEHDCHACAPVLGAAIFSRGAAGWTIEVAQKSLGRHGAWGKPPQPTAVKLGADKHAVFLEWSDGGFGYFSGGIDALAVIDGYLREVLEFETFSDNSGSTASRGEHLVSTSKYELVPRAGSDYHDVRVRTTGTKGAGKGRRAVVRPFTSIATYRFADKRYAKLPKPESSPDAATSGGRE